MAILNSANDDSNMAHGHSDRVTDSSKTTNRSYVSTDDKSSVTKGSSSTKNGDSKMINGYSNMTNGYPKQMNGTTTRNFTPTGVHLVGSIPLPSASDVFSKAITALPGRLSQVPDGEPGQRQYFVIFQQGSFQKFPQILRDFGKIPDYNSLSATPPTQSELDHIVVTIKSSDPIETTYDTHAISSYATFKFLQKAGTIPLDVKFQVSLPSPLNALLVIDNAYQAAIEPIYEEALLRALRNIENNIPHSSLVVQWDLATEFASLEGIEYPWLNSWWSPVRQGIIDRAVRLINAVSPTIDVGIHLCYGDVEHRHYTEPKNMNILVEFANDLKKQANRDITYFHMPVPKDRTDDAYFTPLKRLHLEDTKLYLGLVHYDDLAGTKERIRTAARILNYKPFGVATECGMGRTPADQLENILAISAAVSSPVSM